MNILPKKSFYCSVIFLVGCLFPAAQAADITWDGSNSNSGNADTDINNPSNWSPTTNVPGAGDTAIFRYVGDSASKLDLYVSNADTNFIPDRLIFLSNVNPGAYKQTADLYIDKNLNLTNGLKIEEYGSSTGSANRNNNRLRIGTQALGITVNMSDLDLTVKTPSWGFFNLGRGDANPGNSTVLNFTGPTITFTTPTTTLSSDINTSGGSLDVENATNDLAPQMRFTNVGGTINLQQAGKRSSGTIGLGYVHLDVRSDQTWNADDLAFIRMTGSTGAPGMSGRFVVESIDGGRLDNLGELNIRMNGGVGGSSASSTTAMQLHGGTYGSLWMNSTGSSGRQQGIQLNDDVTFMKNAVDFDGSGDPFQTEYGLILRNAAGNSDGQVIYMNGHSMTVENSVLLEDAVESTNATRNVRIQGEDGTLIVKGDFRMQASVIRSPGGTQISNDIGIDGGANGMEFKLGGSWDVRTLALGSNNLSTSTMTMNGGTVGTPVTFEVGDAAATTGVQASTWSVDTLNIGETLDTAHVRLMNDYLNDNPGTKDGEKLIVDTLNINAGSLFDVNLDEADVEVGSTFFMGAGAMLDLNTGLTLSDGDLIGNFMGLGDQTATWDLYAPQVTDSSNSGFTFVSYHDGSNTFWQGATAAIPEASTLVLSSMALLMALAVSKIRRN